MSFSSSPRPARLAFVGTGNWARQYHLPSLKHIREHKLGGVEVVLHGIYGIKQDEASELAGKYGFGRVYSTLDDLIRDREVDAVAVVISPEAVKEVVAQLLPMNVPLITEKPPGANYMEARELADLVRVTNVVCFNRRYGLTNNRFKQRVAHTKGIVKVKGQMYRKNRREPHFVLHTGPHLINFMEYVFGPIRAVRNERRANAATGEREYAAHLRFESGLAGEILFSPCSDRHWEGIDVESADQTLVLHSPHNDAPGEIVARDHGHAGEERLVDRSAGDLPILEEGYAWEHVDLLTAMSTGAPTRSNFRNALNTMRVAEAIETGQDLSTWGV